MKLRIFLLILLLLYPIQISSQVDSLSLEVETDRYTRGDNVSFQVIQSDNEDNFTIEFLSPNGAILRTWPEQIFSIANITFSIEAWMGNGFYTIKAIDSDEFVESQIEIVNPEQLDIPQPNGITISPIREWYRPGDVLDFIVASNVTTNVDIFLRFGSTTVKEWEDVIFDRVWYSTIQWTIPRIAQNGSYTLYAIQVNTGLSFSAEVQIDRGDIIFVEAERGTYRMRMVEVMVIDQTNIPQEGLLVKILNQAIQYEQSEETNDDGIARFEVYTLDWGPVYISVNDNSLDRFGEYQGYINRMLSNETNHFTVIMKPVTTTPRLMGAIALGTLALSLVIYIVRKSVTRHEI